MKNMLITYMCDICEREYNPFEFFDTSIGLSPFNITFINTYNDTPYTATRQIDEVCPECAQVLIDAFVSIKKS